MEKKTKKFLRGNWVSWWWRHRVVVIGPRYVWLTLPSRRFWCHTNGLFKGLSESLRSLISSKKSQITPSIFLNILNVTLYMNVAGKMWQCFPKILEFVNFFFFFFYFLNLWQYWTNIKAAFSQTQKHRILNIWKHF